MRTNFFVAIIAFGCLHLGTSAHANDKLIEMSKNPADWVMPLGNYAGHRYSELGQVNKENAHDLQVAWMFSTGVLRGHEGGPLKVGNMLYFVTPFPNKVYALDLNEDGKIVWKYEPKPDPETIPVMCCDTVNRGLAYSDGVLFLHRADAHVEALNAQTGDVIWSVKNGDFKRGETGTAAPLVVNDKVLVGISGGEFAVDCHLTALDKETGKRVWRAYTNGSDDRILFDPKKTTVLGKPVGKDSSLTSWAKDDGTHGGGCAWGWITYDPDLNLIYYGTGNPAPWNSFQRPGDNKWTNSIIARDADTGVARWVYQVTPHDQWSYDATAENVLVDRKIDGVERKVLQHFDRNGFVYVLDRKTGELISAEKFDPSINWATTIDMDPSSKSYGRPIVDPKRSPEVTGIDKNSKAICPSQIGAKGPSPVSWHRDQKQFVASTNHICMDFEPFPVNYKAGQPYVGATLASYPAPASHGGMGNVIGWDPKKETITWREPQQFAAYSGVLVTKGDVAFYGTLEGFFKVVRVSDGEELYSFKTGTGIVGDPMTFTHQGKQYVAILAGAGGLAAIGLAAGLPDPNAGLSPVGGYCGVRCYIDLGGTLYVFALP